MNVLQRRVPMYQRENCGKHYECRSDWHDNYKVRAHLHRFSEWLFVESGVMTMYLNGERIQVQAGSAVMILPNEVHAYTDETASRALCVVCSNDFIPCLFEKLGENYPESPVFSAKAVADVFREIPKTSPDDAVRFMGLLNLVCSAFLEQTIIVPKKAGKRNPPYREALTYIDEHYREDISLSSMAVALGYHEKYLSAVLGSMSDMNFRNLLASRRVEYACALLRESDTSRSIAEVAHAAGFSSINTFNRKFKFFCGMTPREFQNNR
ncbi:MAG: AraC family transcriptional regulator [Ruminococcaceae bacterium]|nr:AraC family transcriptional regulator [Oscillospiraceae bacterium]